MKRGDKVRIDLTVPVFAGMIGTITKSYPKDTWDDPDCPEFEVNVGVFEDDEYNEVDGSSLWFTAAELELA